jgi:hypothetical protein
MPYHATTLEIFKAIVVVEDISLHDLTSFDAFFFENVLIYIESCRHETCEDYNLQLFDIYV